MLRVLIVDDEPLARENLRVLLQEQSDIEIVGECANAIEDHDHPRVDLVEISTTKYFANDERKHCRGTCVSKSIEEATAEHGPDACFAKQLGKPPHHA